MSGALSRGIEVLDQISMQTKTIEGTREQLDHGLFGPVTELASELDTEVGGPVIEAVQGARAEIDRALDRVVDLIQEEARSHRARYEAALNG